VTQSHNLIIFIKNPVLGHAKTRIAATVGDEAALAIYEKLLGAVRSNTCTIHCNKYLYYSNDILVNDDWDDVVYQKKIQVLGDLGHKMLSAFNEVNLLYIDAPKVLIGSDCPSLTSNIVEMAFDALREHDAVIGPTYDGGYYLIGMNQVFKELFVDIAWSTEAVFVQTMAKADDLGCSVAILPMLNDIDDEADWLEYQRGK